MGGKQVPEGKRYCAFTDSSGGINAAKHHTWAMQRENFGPSTSILIASRGQSNSRTPGPGGLYQMAQHKLGGDTAPKKCSADLG